MSEVMELNREEITRLSRMDDLEGHAWALYLLMKRHMENYTGIVQVDIKILAKVLIEKRIITDNKSNVVNYVKNLLMQLLHAEIISDYIETDHLLSITLPIAFSDVCIENGAQH